MDDPHDATTATFAASGPVHLPHCRRVVTPPVLVMSTLAIALGLAAAAVALLLTRLIAVPTNLAFYAPRADWYESGRGGPA
jgi:hypothetical protein